MPRSSSSLKIRKAVARLKKMTMAERIQLMVKAKLITQEQANEAKRRIVEVDVSSAKSSTPS